jgi:hypothetical protein
VIISISSIDVTIPPLQAPAQRHGQKLNHGVIKMNSTTKRQQTLTKIEVFGSNACPHLSNQNFVNKDLATFVL